MLRKELEASNPELYRQLALYLQVLREVLPRSVDQTCFHLATQLQPGQYAALSKLQRQIFHARLTDLVQHCTCLLTVEQLVSLAARLATHQSRQERRRQRRHERHVEEMIDAEDSIATESSQRHNSAANSSPQQSTPIENPQPQGSVRLDLGLPIEAGWLGWRVSQSGSSVDALQGHPRPLADDDALAGDHEDALAGEELADHESSVDGISHHEALAEALGDFLRDAMTQNFIEAPESEGEMDHSQESADPLAWESDPSVPQQTNDPKDFSDLFSAFAEAAGMGELFRGLQDSSEDHTGAGRGSTESFDRHPSDPEPEGGSDHDHESVQPSSPSPGPHGRRPLRIRSLPLSVAALESDRSRRRVAADPASLFLPPSGGGLLPRDPIVLLAWLDGFEHALVRRLRNLSHALNVLLLQNGLSRVLLPMGLLDAVLAGQIEGQSPQPNLLQLPLPLGLGQGETSLTIHAILLRSADLELEQPRLRTVRGRLQQRRRETRRMAHHYHRLLRRLQAQEAEALWQEDIREMRHAHQLPSRPQ